VAQEKDCQTQAPEETKTRAMEASQKVGAKASLRRFIERVEEQAGIKVIVSGRKERHTKDDPESVMLAR